MPPRETLPSLTAALHPGGHLNVLVVGSATVFGPEASLAEGTLTSRVMKRSPGEASPPVPDSPSAAAFPIMMKAALEAQVPGLSVSLTVRGGRNMAADDMLVLLRAALAEPAHQDLVIWQTGTVDAVRNVAPGQFNQALSDGSDAVAAAGADLILIDPQYSRFLEANADLPPYFSALRNAAALPGVVLFPRFELMQDWADAGTLDIENVPPAEALAAVGTLHACLGTILADMILQDVAP